MAVGEVLIDTIMRSDFVFDRDVSNAPFPPLAFLTFSDFAETRFPGDCPAAEGCAFDTEQLSLAAGLPVWVGRKNLVLAGGALTYNWLDGAREQRVHDAGALAAWVGQPNPAWQAAAFAFPQWHSAGRGGTDRSELMAGAVARRRHSATFHTYYGVVWIGGEPDQYLLPYLGLDWYPSDRWVVSLVMPWPAVTWAPNRNRMIRLGVAPAGASWQFDAGGGSRSADLSRWNFGLSYEQRLVGRIWGGVGAGITGLASLRLTDGRGLDVTGGLEREPYVQAFLHFRPEA